MKKSVLMRRQPSAVSKKGTLANSRKSASKKMRKPAEAKVAKKKGKKVAAPAKIMSASERLAKVYSKHIDSVDKTLMLDSSFAKQPQISSGLLALDLSTSMMKPGFHVYVGAEASAKSTGAMTALGSALKSPIPMRKYYDAEQAIDRKYTGGILRVPSLSSVFGQRDKQGRWIIPPQCRYHSSNILETVFRSIHRSIAMFPDKVFNEQDGNWYLVFGRSKPEIAMIKDLELSNALNKNMYQQTGKYWANIGPDDDSPQGFVAIDSLPSLVPKDLDEEEISDKSAAIFARKIGPMLALVRGKLRSKGVILLAVNQLRDNPRPGPGQLPFYEPGGNAIKFASDVRTMFGSRVPQDNFPRYEKNKGLCAEPSVEFEGRIDKYAFKAMRNLKNKTGEPFRDTHARVWISDGNNRARGFDLVYDTYKFLSMTGLIQGNIHDKRKPFRVNIPKIADGDFTWTSFKTLVLAETEQSRSLMSKAIELGAPRFLLRKACIEMLKNGKAEQLYTMASVKKAQAAPEVDLEADEDD